MSLLLLQNGDLPSSAKKLLDMLNDQPTMRKLQTEIAITIDAIEAFVKATYNLEGEQFLWKPASYIWVQLCSACIWLFQAEIQHWLEASSWCLQGCQIFLSI